MHIRLIEERDIPEIISLGRQLLELHQEYDLQYYQLEDNFNNLFEDWVKQQIGSSYQFILVAQDESAGKIAGFISGFIKALFPWFKVKSVGHISYMVINPLYRQKGIGRLLEEAAVNWFKSKDISYAELYVEENNHAARIAWDKYGYLPFKKFLKKKV